MKKGLFSILALTLLVAPLAGAQGSGGSAEDRGRMKERFAERLGLSEETAEQLHEKMRSHRESMTPMMDDLRVARRGLDKQIAADTFDEAAIRDASARVAELEADLAVSRAQQRQEMRNLLTDEQWAEFEELRERRERGSMGAGHGGQQRRPGGHGRGR